MEKEAWKDNVVVLGGKEKEGNVRNTMILYNVTTESHRMFPEMTEKQCYCTAVTIGDNIIAIGAYNETQLHLIL